MNVSALLRDLAKDTGALADDVQLLHDMAYWPQRSANDQPRVTTSRIDPAVPHGSPVALAAWQSLVDLSTVLLVRLAYLCELHRAPVPALAVGQAPAAVRNRLTAATGALEALAGHPALRRDTATLEQLQGRHNSPAIVPCVDQLRAAHRSVLPQPTADELAALADRACANCGHASAMKGRKRCAACHAHFSRHHEERSIPNAIDPTTAA
jgi:hypothetical protein